MNYSYLSKNNFKPLYTPKLENISDLSISAFTNTPFLSSSIPSKTNKNYKNPITIIAVPPIFQIF